MPDERVSRTARDVGAGLGMPGDPARRRVSKSDPIPFYVPRDGRTDDEILRDAAALRSVRMQAAGAQAKREEAARDAARANLRKAGATFGRPRSEWTPVDGAPPCSICGAVLMWTGSRNDLAHDADAHAAYERGSSPGRTRTTPAALARPARVRRDLDDED